jgi:hypothetical protein
MPGFGPACLFQENAPILRQTLLDPAESHAYNPVVLRFKPFPKQGEMMSKKPADLTDAAWKKIKASTLFDTGMGKVLREWEAARKLCNGPPTRNLAAFADALVCLNKINTQAAAAEKKANKTLHAGTIEALKEYPKLVTAAKSTLASDKQKYDGYTDNWKDIRVRLLKNMTKVKKEMEDLIAGKVAATVKTCNESKNAEAKFKKASVDLAKTMLKELTAKQKVIDKTLEEGRVPLSAAESPHADDRPGDVVDHFDKCRQIQVDIIAMRQDAEAKLNKGIEANS